MNESIFGSLARKQPSAPPRPHNIAARRIPAATQPPPPAAATPFATLKVVRAAEETPPASSPPWPSSCDSALLAILESPLPHGETLAVGFARKESELRHILATLSVVESRALQFRLVNAKSGDQLAKSFLRLTADRRARLINFLADVRRREATRR